MSRSEQAVELVRSGLSKAEAARVFGLTRWAVGFACKKHGLPLGYTRAGRKAAGNRRSQNPHLDQRIKAMRSEGLTYAQIAEFTGVSIGTVAGRALRMQGKDGSP